MPLNKYDEFYEQYMPELTRRLSEFPSWVESIPNHRQGKPYIAYSTGKSGIQYYSEYTSRGYIGGNNKGFIVGIYIDGTDYKQKLDYFKQFESILDNSLVWLDTGKAGRIFYKLSGLVENKSEWANVITWQIEKLIKTMNEFKPYITEFNPNVKIRTKNTLLKKEVEVINKISLNQILYGPPGTGKTYNTINKALEIIDGEVPDDRSEAKSRFEALQKAGQIEFVTFHQSYGYEEFVEGIKAQSLDGEISYDVEGGVFKKLCEEAEENSQKNYIIIIDEINRGNISKIFGELITLIEPSKRIGAEEEIKVRLPWNYEYSR